jgi:glycosyltransferase involved in cell wall biosynthesis
MLNYEFPPIGGGAGKAHLCLLKECAGNSELIIDVLTSAPKPGFTTEKLAENVTVYKVGVHKKNLHFWRRVEVIEWLVKARVHYRRLLGRNSYDFAHAFFGFPTGWLCYRTRKRLPYMISLRGSDVPGRHARLILEYKLLGPVFKAIWTKASLLVACSEGLKMRAFRFLPSVSIEVIPNGVDLDRFHPGRTDENKDVLKLLTVGRLSVTKRVELLIEAVERLCRDGHSVRFAIVGGGGMEKRLRQMVLQKNLGHIINVTGRIAPEKMPDLYHHSDVFVSASMQEGMSNAMLEAMASGLPIVTTRCEGVEELVGDNGVVVEQPNAASIAQAVAKLAGDSQGYERMCLAARKRAENFSWSSVAEQYLTSYRRVAQDRL